MTLADYLQKYRLGPFKPGSFLDKEIGIARTYSEDVPHYAQHIDGFLTLFRAMDDDRIIGASINGLTIK